VINQAGNVLQPGSNKFVNAPVPDNAISEKRYKQRENVDLNQGSKSLRCCFRMIIHKNKKQ